MSNGNTITTILAAIGGARLALNAAGVAHRAYLTKRIGSEYITWRTLFRENRDARNVRNMRRLAKLCERHGLTGTAAFYNRLADTAENTAAPTHAYLNTAMRDFQRMQERVNRDYL